MPKKSSSRAGQQDFLKLAQLVQWPFNDAAAAAGMVKGVVEASQLEKFRQLAKPPRTSSDAAALASCVAAALQCAGWLVAAHGCNPLLTNEIWYAVGCCVVYSGDTVKLMLHSVGPDLGGLLQVLLQPSAASHVPGFTTWVPLLAQGLVDRYATFPSHVPSTMPASEAAAEVFASYRVTSALAERLVDLWDRCFAAWDLANSNNGPSSSSSSSMATVKPTAWLHPSVLQLADALLQRQLVFTSPNIVMHTLIAAPSIGAATLLAHPQLAAAAGGQAGNPLVAAALQQGCWWRVLATCVTALANVTAAAAGAGPRAQHHPGKFCPAYHLEQAYASQPLQSMRDTDHITIASLALNVLLVGQLWDVVPWQVQQLQQLQRAPAPSNDGAASAGSNATVKCTASSSSAAGATSNVGTSGRLVGGNHPGRSSSSSSREVLPSQQVASLLGSTALPAGLKGWEVALRATGLDWSLLPDRDAGSTQQEEEGVTLQQLQLAVSAVTHVDAAGAVGAALLLALLLQRADPGLRASFLAGPGGTALLAAAQHWSRDSGVDVDAWQFTQVSTMYKFEPGAEPMAEGLQKLLPNAMLSVLFGGSQGVEHWVQAGALHSLALLLGWCYLQLPPGWEVSQARPGPPCRGLFMTKHSHTLLGMGTLSRPECLAVEMTPAEAFQFAPGCAPTPLLLGTLEALLRKSTWVFDSNLLRCAVAFIHATIVWIGDAASRGINGAAPGVFTVGSQEGGTSSGSSNTSSTAANSSSCGVAGAYKGPCQVDPAGSSPAASDPSSSTASSSGQTNSGGQNSCSADSSSNQSRTSTADSSALLGSLASLAVSLGALLRQDVNDETTKRLRSRRFGLEDKAISLIPPCCVIAAKLLQLAAQQLQVSGPQALPALQLAAAAQQLAAACAEQAEGVIAAQGAGCLEYIETSMRLLLDELMALRDAQPWWQQQPSGQQSTAAEAGESAVSSSSSDGSSQQAVMPIASSSNTENSSSRFDPLDKHTKQVVTQVVAVAREIRCKCRSRLQLVGCSHPHCANLSGPCAEGLVVGCKGVRCGGCRVARYCSAACQRADWPQHRHVCRRLAAGAAAGVGVVRHD